MSVDAGEIIQAPVDPYSRLALALVRGAVQDLDSTRSGPADKTIALDYLLDDGLRICDLLPTEGFSSEQALDWLIGRLSEPVAWELLSRLFRRMRAKHEEQNEQ